MSVLELFTTSAASGLLMLGEKRALTEVLITSSVLILALLVLRGAFRRSLSRRMQYALWALVLLRLLVPFQLPGFPCSPRYSPFGRRWASGWSGN